MDILMEEYQESVKGRIEQGYLLPGQSHMLYHYNDILHQMEGFATVLFAGLSQRTVDFHPRAMADFAVLLKEAFGADAVLGFVDRDNPVFTFD
jgi:transcription-repair coupling factor (superfamily II helicase)